MYNFLIIELLHWIVVLFLPVYTVFSCSCNDRNREQMHLERRQALRDRQREAVSEGRSVRSVIETEVEPETTQCPRMTCVRMAPRLKSHSHGGVHSTDVYDRLSRDDERLNRMRMQKEKPPQVEIPMQKMKEKEKKDSQESSEEYPDERDKLSAEKDSSSSTGSRL